MKGRIAWLVPYPIEGSGGHRTIFSHIRHLCEKGHDCHVYIGADPRKDMHKDFLREFVEECYGPCPANIYSGYDEAKEHYDIAVATAWWTAELVANKIWADNKVYFVQDFEPCFNPMGDVYIQAENSYRLGLIPITIGRWLSSLLQQRYGSEPNFFEFSADQEIYFPIESVVKEQAVCFIYQPEKPRRCPILGREALATVKHHYPEVKIYTYGTDVAPNYHFDHTHLGILSREECNLLYNRCAVGLCLSSSNPSRVPFEMMAAGLPAVDFYGENTIYDMPENGVLLAERNASSLAGAIINILHSTDLREKMRQTGLQFMKQRPASLEFDQFASHVEDILARRYKPAEELAPLYQSPTFRADFELPSFPEAETGESIEAVVPEKQGLYQRICQNRIGRVLKVLWRGYY